MGSALGTIPAIDATLCDGTLTLEDLHLSGMTSTLSGIALRMGCGVAAAAALLLSAPTAQAQIAPYAMFAADHYSGLGVGPGTAANQSGGITPLGGIFGVQDEFVKAGPVHLGSDVRFLIANSSNSTPYGDKMVGGLFGGRLSVNPLVLPLRPYIQAEIGAVAQNNGTSPSKNTNFAYQVQLGGDWTLIPHLAARVEYGVGQVESSPNHTLQTFGAGLVLRLF